MEGFLLYILKSAGISTLFLLCYMIFLKKETFFNANRIFLLTGLVLPFLIPLISIKEVVWIEPIFQPSNNGNGVLEPDSDNTFALNWIVVLSTIYGLGTVFLLIRLMVNLLSLKRIVSKGDCQKENGINFVETQKNTTPFSFFNYLIYNPETLTKSDFATIVTHERVHIEGFHSLDILLMHTVILLQWFNPFIWLYKESIEHNLEFIADRGALQLGRDPIEYQNLMLRTMVGATHPYFSNSFYNSIIKKRIVMLNKQRSKKSNVWKFGIILPLLVGFMLTFQTTTVAQINVTGYGTGNSQFEDVYSIKKNSTDAEISEIKSSIEQKGGTFTYSLTRNAKDEITELEWQMINEGGAKFTSTTPFMECYFGTLKGGGVFMATEMEDGKPKVIGTSKKKNENSNGDVNLNSTSGDIPSSIKINESDEKVSIRISSNNPPLIVIDGKKQPKADMNNLGLEPEEIESINVLKDEKAMEKYGEKGKNGVIEITTKKED